MLEIREKRLKPVPVVALVGALTTQSVPELQRHLDKLLAASPTIVLDLSDLKYISSAGVALFIKIGSQARKGEGALRLAHPQRTVKETLAILRLNASELLFQVHPTVEAALKG